MPQLIQMRQHIRTVETIKKITYAMRLISMSAHSQLSKQAPHIKNYQKELSEIFDIILSANSEVMESLPTTNDGSPQLEKRSLIILIGSQKGFSGIFNSALFRFFEKKVNLDQKNIDYIAVGKKAADYLKKKVQIKKSYENLSMQTINDIAYDIFSIITQNEPEYSNVYCFSNFPKSFFIQVPEEYTLVPIMIKNSKKESLSSQILEHYVWEQSISEIANILEKEYLHSNIQTILFNSLFAEQAARFQSMDNATKSAQDLLETLKRQYNKLRQAKITKEISEVSSSL